MRKISLMLALMSIPAFATPQATSYERSLSRATKWSDISAQLKGRLPSNVVKEFADFSKSVEFPSARRIKNKLVITQNDGTKVTVVFKKDGVISLNGKDWRFAPLGTVEEEVSRLALFLGGEKKAESSLFGLLPEAQAGGAGALGAAAAVYAGANAWKADACAEKSLSEDLSYDCPLMAVKMQPLLVKARKIDDPELFLPVNLKCPAENGGTLELLSKNILGQAERIRIGYMKGKAAVVSLAGAEKGLAFEEITSLKIAELMDENEKGFAKVLLNRGEPLLKKVCNGSPKEKNRFFAFLKSNRSDLNQTQVEDLEGEKRAVEAF